MDIIIGKSYHISNEFFIQTNDNKLMVNKEGVNYRPHFFFFKDMETDGIYWAVPQSTKVEKYSDIIQKKIQRYGKCDTIIIGDFGGRKNAFLIQNMFPIIEKYVEHEHLVKGRSVDIHPNLSNTIISSARTVLSLHRHGHKLIFPDIDHIYDTMKQILAMENSKLKPSLDNIIKAAETRRNEKRMQTVLTHDKDKFRE